MHKQLGLRGKVEVDDVVEHGDVDAPGGEVCHHQHVGGLVTELGHVDLTRRLVEGTVAAGARDPRLAQHLAQGEGVINRGEGL